MNQYPKEEPQDNEEKLLSLSETERRIRELLSKMAKRFHFVGEPQPRKMITVMTPTEKVPHEYWVMRHVEADSISNPTEVSFVSPPGDDWNEKGNRRFMPLNFDKVEARIAANYAHLLPSFYPNLMEVARIREENIARVQNKLVELSSLYGKDMTEKVNEAAEKLNRSLEDCIDLFRQFKNASIIGEKISHYENVRKLISEIKLQVGETNKKETHATRDKIPVPKSYKRNRFSK